MDRDKTREQVRDRLSADSTSGSSSSFNNSTFHKLDSWDFSHADELPAFSIRALSPSSRSPSPIENIAHISTSLQALNLSSESHEAPEADTVSLDEINAQINTPLSLRPNRSLSLDTIFEGVFLETPPRRLDCNLTRYDGPNSVVRSSLCFFSTLEEEKVQPN